MAYALAIKSEVDFGNQGKKFLIVTLIFTGFTLLYSSLFVNLVIKACGLLEYSKEVSNDYAISSDCFGSLKSCCNYFHEHYLKPFVSREKELSLIDEFKNTDRNDLNFKGNFKQISKSQNIVSQKYIYSLNDNSFDEETENNSKAQNKFDSLHVELIVNKVDEFTL